MIELAYTSTTAWVYSREDLADILAVSRRNNARNGITGILFYRRRTILQLLEGEESPVRALYQKLQADRRHHGLAALFERPISARSFDRWSMAFEPLEEDASFDEGVHRILGNRIVPELGIALRHRRLVDTFVQHVH